MALRNGEFTRINSKEIFNGRRVVLFALPDAYTPRCSIGHVPRFVQIAELRKHDGDEMVWLAVNDPFVMDARQREQNAADLTFLPDAGSCALEAFLDGNSQGKG
jgi:peroxiredoxin